MLKKYKYLVIGLALILFVTPMVVMSGRLDDPRTNRDCYKGNLPFYVCVIEGTNIMEKSFLTHPEMKEYYTPQLKEVVWSTSNQAIQSGKRTIGTFTVSNSAIEYSYVKKG
jgi:hypothetical protein